MKPTKRLATALRLGLALAAGAVVMPKAQGNGNMSAAESMHAFRLPAAAVPAAQPLADRSATASSPRPDFSGHWILNGKSSDDPREKAKEAVQAAKQPSGGGRGMGGGAAGMGRGGGMGSGRQGRAAARGMDAGGGLSFEELSALLAPARELHVTHADPMLLIADENDRRQRLFTDFRGASVSVSGGLQQRVAVAGWEGGVLVVETTALGKKIVQSFQIDGSTGQLVIAAVAEFSSGQSASYRLVYDRFNPDMSRNR